MRKIIFKPIYWAICILLVCCSSNSISAQNDFNIYPLSVLFTLDDENLVFRSLEKVETFAEVNNRLLFISNNENKLKSTDGITVDDLTTVSNSNFGFVYNDRYFFSDFSMISVTDGTAGGTEVLYVEPEDQFPNSPNSFANNESNNHAIFNGQLYILINREIFRYNNNTNALQRLAGTYDNIWDLKAANGQLYFYRFDPTVGGSQLEYYVGDGTIAGSTLIHADGHSFNTGCAFKPLDTVEDDYVIYRYTSCTSVDKLFVNDIEVPTSFDSRNYFIENNILHVEVVNDGIYQFINNSFQLVAPTDFPTRAIHSKVGNQNMFFAYNFLGDISILYAYQNGNISEIFNFQNQNLQIKDILLTTENEVYFSVFDEATEVYSLWKTNGTSNGTTKVADLVGRPNAIQIYQGDIYYGGTGALRKISFDPNFNPPVTTISTPNTTVNGPFTVNVNFSQPVTGFNLEDISIDFPENEDDPNYFTFSNLTGSGQNYSFLASTSFPGSSYPIRIVSDAAQSSSGQPSLASNLLRITTDLPVNSFCDAIQVSTGANSISVGPNFARRTSVLIFENGGVLFECGTGDCPQEINLDNVPAGSYPYTITMWLADFSESCMLEGTIVVTGNNGCIDNDNDGICMDQDCNDTNPNIPATPGSACDDFNANTNNDVIQNDGCTCAGTPINNGGCNIATTVSGTSIIISSMTADMNIKLFDAAFTAVYECNPWNSNPCSGSTTVSGLNANTTYFLSVQSDSCDEFIPVTTGDGGPCTDYDGDGICQADDCNDNDRTVPATVGSSCDDFNSSTNNDIIQSDGCTCAGTPIPGGDCNIGVVGIGANNIQIFSMTPDMNLKLFDASFGAVYECNPWNGNPCNGSTIVDGLDNNTTYFLSVQSDNCNEWIPVTTLDGTIGCTDNDGDGLCQEDDCNDNNANIPAIVGSGCNDNNPNTNNDVFQSDGCTCAGTPINTGSCTVDAGVAGSVITIFDMTPDMNIKLFNAAFEAVYECNPWNGNPCNGTETVNGLAPNTAYFLSVQSDDCDEYIPLTTSSPDVACTDNDNDGFCQEEDCNDSNPNVPTTVGSACNDNNSNTNNDVILSDGCTCAGTPINSGGCNVAGAVSGTTVTISGMTADMNIKLFDGSFAAVYECNPWNGNPCSGSTTVTGLDANTTYFLSVQSDDCDEFIPLTTGSGNNTGGGNNDLVLNCPSDFTFQLEEFGTSGPVFYDVTATSGCAGPVEIDIVGLPSGSIATINSAYPITATATDQCGNIETCTFTLSVSAAPFDETQIICPDNIVVTANDNNGAIVTWNDPELISSCNLFQTRAFPASGSLLPIGTTEVNFVYGESGSAVLCGSFASCFSYVTVLPPGGSTQPDLAITNLDVPDDINLVPGQVTDFTFDLNNFSATTASGDYSIKAYFSDNNTLDASDVLVGEIITGNTGGGTIPDVVGGITVPNLPDGFYQLIIVVDDENVITESNEDNNTLTSFFLFLISNSEAKIAAPSATTYHIENLYPNPTRSELFVQLSASGENTDVALRVSDVSGRVVQDQSIVLEEGLKSFSLDVEDLNSGIYFLQVVGEHGIETKRFVKE